MRNLVPLIAALVIGISSAHANDPKAALGAPSVNELQATLDDIKQTLGLVPDMFKLYPEQALPAAWQTLKAIQLNPNSAIPCRYKELLGLAVSAQIPCHYCTFFHTEAAKLNGASDAEIKEAVALASLERQWSTFLSGYQTDFDDFKQMTDQFIEKTKRAAAEASASNMNFTSIPASPEATYAEVAQTFGRVPEFIRNIPPAGVSGAWGGLKVLAFNPHTAIPPKYKDLITLAVSAQIPCSYCVYFDTQTARLDGATEEEINEAIGMAAMSRHWSTVLNGMQIDSSRFRKQLTQAFAYIKKQSAPSPHNSQAKTRG